MKDGDWGWRESGPIRGSPGWGRVYLESMPYPGELGISTMKAESRLAAPSCASTAPEVLPPAQDTKHSSGPAMAPGPCSWSLEPTLTPVSRGPSSSCVRKPQMPSGWPRPGFHELQSARIPDSECQALDWGQSFSLPCLPAQPWDCNGSSCLHWSPLWKLSRT